MEDPDVILAHEARLRRQRRRLGVYLSVVALYQCLLAVGGETLPALSEPALYLTPRFWTLLFVGVNDSVAHGVSFATGLLSLAAGWWLTASPTATRLWMALFAETVLALPSFLILGTVFIANMSPAHGMSRREIVVPLVVFAVASAVPLLAGASLRFLSDRVSPQVRT